MTSAVTLPSPARRTRPPLLPLVLAGIAAVAMGALVAVLLRSGGGEASPTRAIRAEATVGFAPLDDRISVLEARVVPGDGDYLNRTALAAVLVEAARSTGDPAAAERAEVLVTEALANNPGHLPAESLLASIELARHDFAGALARAEAVVTEAPGDLGALAVVGDANLELGRIAEAQEAYFELGRAGGGSPAVLIRRARLAWLSGDADAAVVEGGAALDAAIDGGLGGADLASYQAQHALQLVGVGRAGEAAPIAEAAVDNAPSSPGVLAALAEVRLRQGDLPAAVDLLDRAIAIAPTPDLLAAAVELALATDDAAAAEELTATVLAIAELADANGEVADRRAIAEFLADRGIDTARAVELARAEADARPGAMTLQVLAWALHADGQLDEAVQAAEQVLASGLTDAEVLARVGVILAADAQDARAAEVLDRALRIDDRFDPIAAPQARALLDSLEVGR